jgi:hypothetical protein
MHTWEILMCGLVDLHCACNYCTTIVYFMAQCNINLSRMLTPAECMLYATIIISYMEKIAHNCRSWQVVIVPVVYVAFNYG